MNDMVMETKNEIAVGVVQYNIAWEDKLANLNRLDSVFVNLRPVDIIILPELFATGFSMKVKDLSEKNNGYIVQWMKEKAFQRQAMIIGSVMIEDNGKYFNRLLGVYPDGRIAEYNKRHLFRMGEEHRCYTQGDKITILEYHGWRINLLICYDLRFPVWSRNANQYDAAIYVANWPSARSMVWEKLLMARAIENQSYVIGANRIGSDGNNLMHNGNSMIVDPKGNIMVKALPDKEMIIYADLNLEKLNQFRNDFPVWKDIDNFRLL